MRRFVIAILGAWQAWGQAPAETIQSMLDQAALQRRRGDATGAVATLREAMKKTDGDPEGKIAVALQLAGTAGSTQDTETAFQYYDLVIEQGTPGDQALAANNAAFLAARQTANTSKPRAEQYWAKLEPLLGKLDADQRALYNTNRARLWQMLGEPVKAFEQYRRVAGTNPEYLPALSDAVNLILSRLEAPKFRWAADLSSRLVEAGQNGIAAHFMLDFLSRTPTATLKAEPQPGVAVRALMDAYGQGTMDLDEFQKDWSRLNNVRNRAAPGDEGGRAVKGGQNPKPASLPATIDELGLAVLGTDLRAASGAFPLFKDSGEALAHFPLTASDLNGRRVLSRLLSRTGDAYQRRAARGGANFNRQYAAWLLDSSNTRALSAMAVHLADDAPAGAPPDESRYKAASAAALSYVPGLFSRLVIDDAAKKGMSLDDRGWVDVLVANATLAKLAGANSQAHLNACTRAISELKKKSVSGGGVRELVAEAYETLDPKRAAVEYRLAVEGYQQSGRLSEARGALERAMKLKVEGAAAPKIFAGSPGFVFYVPPEAKSPVLQIERIRQVSIEKVAIGEKREAIVVPLTSPLDAGDVVVFRPEPEAAPSRTKVESLEAPLAREVRPPHVGDRFYMGAAPEGTESVQLEVRNAGVLKQEATVDVSHRGLYAARLRRRLEAGDSIVVTRIEEGVPSEPGKPVPAVRLPIIARTQNYLQLGVVFANDSAGRVAGFEGNWNSDINWSGRAPEDFERHEFLTLDPSYKQSRSEPRTARAGYLLNTFIEPRIGLQSIFDGNANEKRWSETFSVNYGAYFPVYLQGWSWVWANHRHAFFVAPLVKSGLDIHGGDDSPGLSRAFGARIGILRFTPREYRTAPELLSHIDYTYGTGDSIQVAAGGTEKHRLNQDRVRAILQHPKTVFYVGADATFGPGQHFVRVFGGLRVNMQSPRERM